MITTTWMQDHIAEQLQNRIDDGNTKMAGITSFKKAGVLSGDAGFEVEMVDGSKFWIKIIPEIESRKMVEEQEDDSWHKGMLSRVPEKADR